MGGGAELVSRVIRIFLRGAPHCARRKIRMARARLENK